MKRTISGVATIFTYDGWKPIVELDASGTRVNWNLYGPGPDEILVRFQYDTGGYTRYHLDAMGNVRFLLGQNNLGLEKYTYDVFGRPTITGWDGDYRKASICGNRFLFTGREYLYTLGLYDYRHRFYHPGLGRFIQTDPMGLQIEGAKLSTEQTAFYPAGQAPATFNASELDLYRYCHNDPVNKTDPTGLIDEGHMEPDALEGAVQGSQKLLSSIGHDIAQEYREQGPVMFVVNAGMMLSRGPKVEGIRLPGFRPPPGTRIRPEGVPTNWRIRPTEGEGGTMYINPNKPNETVRVMPGNPNSPYPNSRTPYVVQTDSAGRPLDANGKPGERKSENTHVPLDKYKFQTPR